MTTPIPLHATPADMRTLLEQLCPPLAALNIQTLVLDYRAQQGVVVHAQITTDPVRTVSALCIPMAPDDAALVPLHWVMLAVLKMVLARHEPSFVDDTQPSMGHLSLDVPERKLTLKHYQRCVTEHVPTGFDTLF